MRHASGIVAALLAALLVGGLSAPASAQSADAASVRAPDNNPPSAWPAATVLIAPSPPAPDGSDVVWSWVSGAGMVQATRQTTAGIGQELPAAPGRNLAVEPCRVAAWNDAAKLGARDIEAVSAGPQRKDRWGRLSAPVRLRLTYAGFLHYEIREGVMTCTVDKNGNVVEAAM